MNRFLKIKGDERESSEKSKKVVVRENDPEFIKYGFMNAGTDLESKPQCVECTQILSNEALKPSKLQRRLNSKHPEVAGEPKEYFARKRKGM